MAAINFPEFLVYSSHKSGTQTVTATLRASLTTALHLHSLRNVGYVPGSGQFLHYLSAHRGHTGRKQVILSTFRLPLERNISSFFQWYGTGVLTKGLVASVEDTLIARASVEQLVGVFAQELQAMTLTGYEESLVELSSEMSLDLRDFCFHEAQGFGLVETDLMRLYLFRYDLLFSKYPSLLESVVGKPLTPVSANIGDQKWYAEKYRAFRAALRLSQELIAAAYEDKRQLINVFYPGHYDRLLSEALARYGYPAKRCEGA